MDLSTVCILSFITMIILTIAYYIIAEARTKRNTSTIVLLNNAIIATQEDIEKRLKQPPSSEAKRALQDFYGVFCRAALALMSRLSHSSPDGPAAHEEHYLFDEIEELKWCCFKGRNAGHGIDYEKILGLLYKLSEEVEQS